MKFEPKKDIKRIIIVCLAAVIMALNIKSFVRTGGLYPGGATGLTLLLQRMGELFFHVTIPYTIVNVALNAVPVYIGFRFIGKKFTLYSCLMIVVSGILTDMVPAWPVTEDILLITIFGGILQGVALGIALRGNASSGGTDFIAMWISQRTNQPAWNYILAMNAVMLVAAGYLFGWNAALYSIIFQFCSTQVINFVHTRYKRMTLFIVTSNPDIVIEEIQNSTHHGVTRLEGIGTYYGRPRTMLYTVVDSQNVKGLVTRIREIDQTSFVNVTKTESVEGKFYQRPIE